MGEFGLVNMPHRLAAACLALILLALPSAVSARCLGSDIPIVIRAELMTGRDPEAAVGWIDKAIARTDPADRRTLANLYLVKTIAYSMSGQDNWPTVQKAMRIAAPLPKDDPINLALQLSKVSRVESESERSRLLGGVTKQITALPAGQSRSCLMSGVAYLHIVQDNLGEGFKFASQAYRDADSNSRARAEAASLLAYVVSEGGQFAYAKQLHSEALSFFRVNNLHDLAANEYSIRGGCELAMGDWKGALEDYNASLTQALSYGNGYAAAYAEVGICKALLAGNMVERAAPSCNAAYTALNKPRETMALAAGEAKASLLLRQDNPAAAVSLLNAAISQRSGNASAEIRADAFRTRAAALSALGNNSAAYRDMARADTISEDFHDREKRQATAIAQARFQTEQLRTDLIRQQEASEASKRITLVILICTIAVLLMLGLFVLILLDHRRKLRKLAMTDPLTSLSNRRATLAKADMALREAGNTKPRATIALLDIDRFKRCNDTYGHDAGDEVLREFAVIVDAHMRDHDIVGRWGGEEFIIIFPRTNAQEAATAVERIRKAAEQKTFDFAPSYTLCFSAGLAEFEEAGGDLRKIIKLADRRLYAAKMAGRNRTSCKGEGIDVLASLGQNEPQSRMLS